MGLIERIDLGAADPASPTCSVPGCADVFDAWRVCEIPDCATATEVCENDKLGRCGCKAQCGGHEYLSICELGTCTCYLDEQLATWVPFSGAGESCSVLNGACAQMLFLFGGN
jgi:hypothetical protein